MITTKSRRTTLSFESPAAPVSAPVAQAASFAEIRASIRAENRGRYSEQDGQEIRVRGGRFR